MIDVGLRVVGCVDDITGHPVLVAPCDDIVDELVASSYSMSALGHTGRFVHTNDNHAHTINRARIAVSSLMMVNKYPIA
jgi:hypothetical protein